MCAIVGGILGQEVIKVSYNGRVVQWCDIQQLSLQALSGKDEPYHNCFLYDGVNSTGIVESLRP